VVTARLGGVDHGGDGVSDRADGATDRADAWSNGGGTDVGSTGAGDDVHRPWRTTATRSVYANPWMTVREDTVERPDGTAGIYGVVTLGECVGVLPFLDADTVLMVRQWRYITRQVTWEMVTGGLHPGEEPLAGAQRELAEEINHRAVRLVPITSIVSSKSVVDETAHLYAGFDLEPCAGQADDTEWITMHPLPFARVVDMVLDETIVDAMTVAAVLAVDIQRRRGRLLA